MFLHESLTANGGAGSPTTLGRVVVAKAIFDFIKSDSVSAIVVNDGGDNYVVGETFDIVMPLSPGGVIETFTARGVVTSIGSGSPSASPDSSATRVKIISGGAYLNLVQSPELNLTAVPTTNSSAAGTGLTVDLTIEAAHWTEDRGDGAQSPIASTDYADDATDFEWICTSTKTTNPPTIGMETSQSGGNGALELMVSTGFNKAATLFAQPDVSNEGPKLLAPGTDPELYVSSTERRVNIMIRDGNFVQYGCIGLFIPFTDTEANYPFPGLVAGQTSGYLPFTDTFDDNQSAAPAVANSGIVHPMTSQDAFFAQLPYFLRDNTSPTWLPINQLSNESITRPIQVWPNKSGTDNASYTDAPVVDGHSTDPGDYSIDGIFSDASTNDPGWFETDAGFASRGTPGVGKLGLNNRLSYPVQPHFVQNLTGDVQVIGLLDGFQAVHGIGLTAFEEIIQHQGKRFWVFPDTNSGNNYQWVAMEII